jgi:purine nucleosidase
MAEPKRIILDVDTGVDDALAIAYAVRRPGIKLEAVTTVFGNVDLGLTTANTLRILELFGMDVPVAAGADRPLVKPPQVKELFVHGRNGLGGVELPDPKGSPVGLHAAAYLAQMARRYPGEITLVPVGPLTNVARCLMQDPAVATLFREIVIMGGAVLAPGNLSPVAEANIYNDPDAARIVFASGARIKLVGLDVTMQSLLSHAMADEIAGRGPVATTMMAITREYIDFYQKFAPGIAGAALHDPLAVAVAEDPGLVSTQPMFVQVETADVLTRGQTFADRRNGTGRTAPNMEVCLGVDSGEFIRRFTGIFKE